MESNQECEVCGCKEFLVDAGYYYCQECGTRAKEIQEIQYELTQASSGRVHGKRIKKSSSTKSKEYKLTSWEIYNFILIGLVDELQKIGATGDFKLTTLQLWTSYLTKLEVAFTSKEENLIPKLPIVFKKEDAEILYGRVRKRRKRKATNLDSSSVSLDHTSLDASLISKQRRLENRALVEAEYEAIAGTQQSDTNSVFNSSFHTTKSSTSVTSNVFIQFNSSAKKEQLKHMSSKHFNKHAKDQYAEMKCHKRKPSEKYLKSATFVTRNCLWAILYLALNITENKIQLSDMIRFCREGHISYFTLKHFIPEDYLAENANVEILENAKYKVPCHKQIRTVAYKIAKIINVKHLKRPSIFDLCERYCNELELPPFIAECAQKLSFSNVNEFNDRLPETGSIPNYEGLALAYIIFILKLLLGLDDCSEYVISERVRFLNMKFTKVDQNHMPIFCWEDWSHFIEYRKLIISQKHFPTHNLLNSQTPRMSGNMFVNFWKKIKYMDESDDSRTAQLLIIMKKIFSDLQHLHCDKSSEELFFEPSLTPSKDYFHLIKNTCKDCIIPENIKCQHRDSDFTFFVNGSKNHIDFVDNNVLLKFRNESSNKKLYMWNIQDIEYELDDAVHSVTRNDIVNIKSIGAMEWKLKLEDKFKENKPCTNKVKTAKKNVIKLKNELNEINIMKHKSKQEIEDFKSAKFGGTVDIEKFQYLMIERMKNITATNKLNGKSSASQKFDDASTLRLSQKVLPEVIYHSAANNDCDNIINIPRPVSHYWVNHFSEAVPLTNILFEAMETKFSSSFSWLLGEFSRVIEMSKFDLYQELIKIEQQFGLYQFPDRNRRTI